MSISLHTNIRPSFTHCFREELCTPTLKGPSPMLGIGHTDNAEELVLSEFMVLYSHCHVVVL